VANSHQKRRNQRSMPSLETEVTRMTTGSVTVTAADGVAAPLDLLLTDAALGPLRRFNPGGAGLRLAAALAARPGLGCRAQPATAGRTEPGRGGHLGGGAVPAGPPVHRPSLDREPCAAPGDAGLPGGVAGRRGRSGRGRAGLGRRPAGRLPAGQPGRCARTEQQPATEPGGPESGAQHRGRQRAARPAELRRRHSGTAPGADPWCRRRRSQSAWT